MNDYQRVRQYLEGLTEEEFQSFLIKLDKQVVESPEKKGLVYIVDERGGSRSMPSASWRREMTDDFLRHRENNRSYWNEICYAAGIDTDDAANQRNTRISVICAAIAAISAILSWIANK